MPGQQLFLQVQWQYLHVLVLLASGRRGMVVRFGRSERPPSPFRRRGWLDVGAGGPASSGAFGADLRAAGYCDPTPDGVANACSHSHAHASTDCDRAASNPYATARRCGDPLADRNLDAHVDSVSGVADAASLCDLNEHCDAAGAGCDTLPNAFAAIRRGSACDSLGDVCGEGGPSFANAQAETSDAHREP